MTNETIAGFYHKILDGRVPEKIDQDNWKFGFVEISWDQEQGIWILGYEVASYSYESGYDVDFREIGSKKTFSEALAMAATENFRQDISNAQDSVREELAQEMETVEEVMSA